jgi:uncharacterized membrane protein (DUF106 family)
MLTFLMTNGNLTQLEIISIIIGVVISVLTVVSALTFFLVRYFSIDKPNLKKMDENLEHMKQQGAKELEEMKQQTHKMEEVNLLTRKQLGLPS